jgi:septum formation protein
VPRVILASGSPRRIELLARLVPQFLTFPSPVEEEGSSVELSIALPPLELPAEFQPPRGADPRLWAWRKASDVLQRHSGELDNGDLVLGADTEVVVPGGPLGKPKDRQDALRMLELLRGREHYVVTGLALLKAGQADEVAWVGAVVSRVLMRDYSRTELERYVAQSEPMDKAGAYALQGLGGKLVEQVDGCVLNVVGLPLCEVRRALVEAGAEALDYPKGGYCDFCRVRSFVETTRAAT